MPPLLDQVEDSIRCHQLFRPGQSILIAVSGGLDSMVLLHLLHRLAAAHRWRLVVAHFNHRLRGAASTDDERFVQRTARRLGWPCVVGRGDVRGLAQQQKLSIEMAARVHRHEFLARSARRLRMRTIALAHHADDRMETFFLRLLRGAGCDGLAGMSWHNPSPADGQVQLVRPLLEIRKATLRQFAVEHRLAFHEDRTNVSLEIQRNRIRLQLLPLLRENYQPGLDRVILRLMRLLGDTADFLLQEAKVWMTSSFSAFHPSNVPSFHSSGGSPAFESLPAALQRAIVQTQLIELRIAPDYDLIEGLRCTPDSPFQLNPSQIVRRSSNGRVALEESGAHAFGQSRLEIDLAMAPHQVLFAGVALRWQRKSKPSSRALLPPPKTGREVFDADRVGLRVILRHWQKGDRFQPLGLPQPVKLQDWFTNRKVPRRDRHRLLVATTATGEIWWVENQRIPENFKVTLETKRQLRWEWKRL